MIKFASLMKLAETLELKYANSEFLHSQSSSAMVKFAQTSKTMDDLITEADSFNPNDESLAKAFTKFMDKYIALEEALNLKQGDDEEKDMMGIFQTLEFDYSRVMQNQYLDSEDWEEDFTPEQFAKLLESMMDAAEKHIEAIAEMSIEDASRLYSEKSFDENGQKNHENMRDEVQNQMSSTRLRKKLEYYKEWVKRIKFNKSRREEFSAKRRAYKNNLREQLKNDPTLAAEFERLKEKEKEKSKIHRQNNKDRLDLMNQIKSTTNENQKKELVEKLRKIELEIKARKRTIELDPHGREKDEVEVSDNEIENALQKTEKRDLNVKEIAKKIKEIKSKNDLVGLTVQLGQRANSMVSECKKNEKENLLSKVLATSEGAALNAAQRAAEKKLLEEPSPAAQSAKEDADKAYSIFEKKLTENSPIFLNTKKNVGYLLEFRNKLNAAQKEGVLSTYNKSDSLQMLIVYGKGLITQVDSMYGGKNTLKNLTNVITEIVKKLEELYSNHNSGISE